MRLLLNPQLTPQRASEPRVSCRASFVLYVEEKEKEKETYILNNSTSTVKAPPPTARVGLFVSSGNVFATTRNIKRERERQRERERWEEESKRDTGKRKERASAWKIQRCWGIWRMPMSTAT